MKEAADKEEREQVCAEQEEQPQEDDMMEQALKVGKNLEKEGKEKQDKENERRGRQRGTGTGLCGTRGGRTEG